MKSVTSANSNASDRTTTDYAYNYHAITYDHGLTNRQHRIKLRVRSHSNLKLDFASRTVQGKAYTTPTTEPTPEEAELVQGGEVMLFVGYAPTNFTPNPAGSRKSRGKISLQKKPKVVPYDPQALGIVVTLSSEIAYTYALVDQKDGLCNKTLLSAKEESKANERSPPSDFWS